MYYWNKANFDGLKAAADALDMHPGLELIAEYCRLREKGLRRRAFSALGEFLQSVNSWNPRKARSAAKHILEVHGRLPEAHQFLSQPLLTQFLIPTLEAWVEAEPYCVTGLRWLGILTNNTELLGRALNESPEDVPSRRYLVNIGLSDVDYATHHLVESQFIGELEEARKSLRDARKLVVSAPSPEGFEALLGELEHYEALLSDWVAYKTAPDGTFPEWCKSRGRNYSWPSIFYYEE